MPAPVGATVIGQNDRVWQGAGAGRRRHRVRRLTLRATPSYPSRHRSRTGSHSWPTSWRRRCCAT
jgi:hypothetical protein